jgi:hypothetical protein
MLMSTNKLPSKLFQNVPTMDLETGLLPMKDDGSLRNLGRTDAHIEDLLKLAESKADHLEKSQMTMTMKVTDLENEVRDLSSDQLLFRSALITICR